MRKLIKLSQQDLKDAVWSMPYIDRICILTTSIIEHDKGEPIAACLGLIELVSRMAPYFSKDKRFRIADRLRGSADKIEIAPAYSDEGAI
jgi:hypothetical protein